MTPEEQEVIRSYRVVFGAPAGQTVLLDLMRFCNFRKPCTTPTDEGKRQAFLRIVEMSQLTDDQLLGLYRGQRSIPIGDTNG